MPHGHIQVMSSYIRWNNNVTVKSFKAEGCVLAYRKNVGAIPTSDCCVIMNHSDLIF